MLWKSENRAPSRTFVKRPKLNTLTVLPPSGPGQSPSLVLPLNLSYSFFAHVTFGTSIFRLPSHARASPMFDAPAPLPLLGLRHLLFLSI